MNWNILTTINSNKSSARLSEIIETILSQRGLKNTKEIDQFLHPISPLEITPQQVGIDLDQLDKTVKKIHSAIQSSQPIIIYGDYDADGITATAILWEALYQLGAKATPFIPSREDHGYGLSAQGIKDAIKIQQSGQSSPSSISPLIITVDNGIVAIEAAEYCAQNQIELIITDHHQLGSKKPQCHSMVHTDTIAGSGVAWMLVKQLDPELAQASLDLVTIGTVADMLPLTGPNRSIVKHGLVALRQTKRVGLYALFEETGIDEQEDFSTYHINFVIAPRINAMGRLKHAIDSMRLLCTTDYSRGQKLARLLSDTNTTRQEITYEYLTLAKDLISDPTDQNLLIIDDQDFHEGVIGLVAGKLAETHYRPSIVISRGEDVSKASARSVKGVNIIELIRAHEDLLINAGGHPMAAGFSIETQNIEDFKNALQKTANQTIAPDQLTPSLKIDARIKLTDINDDLFYRLEELKPFGVGNRQPIFCVQNARIINAKALGKERRHLRLKLQDELGNYHQCIGFNLADTPASSDILNHNLNHADLSFSVDENIWNGRRNLQLKLKDIKIV